jgi:histidinol-phosphatase (PHP family)
MLVDYHIHALAHGERVPERDVYEEFLSRAAEKGISHVGFSEHDEYIDQIDRKLIVQTARRYSELNVRVGLEAEYRHICSSPETASRLRNGTFDYVIGSVHQLDGWGFDEPSARGRFAEEDADKLYERYYQELASMVASGLFDIVGHLDLIKIWGYRSSRPHGHHLRPLLAELRRARMAVEVNTAGLRKPVEEIYPEPGLLSLLYEASIPVTLGSDAHVATDIGSEFAYAIKMIKKAGYRKLAVFEKRVMDAVYF